MSSAFILNLALAVVIVGGWALTVRALYRGLAEPAAGPKTARTTGGGEPRHTDRLPSLTGVQAPSVLTDRAA